MGIGIRILRGRSRGKTLYCFSQDLNVSCREFAAIAKETSDNNMAFSVNIACAMLGGSYIEARLNELIAEMAHASGRKLRPSRKFWTVLFEEQKNMPMQQKWDLIASTGRGRLWDASKPPFQSYELLLSLRNELVHYKGKITSSSEPPVKKLKSLMSQFKGTADPMMKAFRISSWVDELLSAPALGSWISGVVSNFDANIHLYLFGRNPKILPIKRAPKKVPTLKDVFKS